MRLQTGSFEPFPGCPFGQGDQPLGRRGTVVGCGSLMVSLAGHILEPIGDPLPIAEAVKPAGAR